MLLFLRWLKQGAFMSERFRKYLAYAVGEMLLVVLGILLALQIDNWNDDRKEQATLEAYLESIARNMEEDLAELQRLRQHRLATRWAAANFEYLRNRDQFDVDEIFFLNQIMVLSGTETFFSANSSGFEALKASGVLDRLQGSGLEHLLSGYYDTVSQIGFLEASLYDAVRAIEMELTRERPSSLESFAIDNPTALPPRRFQELQPIFSSVINSPMMTALVNAQFRNGALIQHYDSLRVLGEAFMHTIGAGPTDQGVVTPRTPVDDWNDGLGHPYIVRAGWPALQSYWLSTTTDRGLLPFRFDSVRHRDDALHIDFRGGTEWAAVYWLALNVALGRSALDFSGFGTLQLELKGDAGGEVVLVHVKDVDYPDDIAPISVELTLSNDWRTYEIGLDEFAPTDFSRLHVVLGFLFAPADEPASFSVRNARYR
jgi:hypothetical protein